MLNFQMGFQSTRLKYPINVLIQVLSYFATTMHEKQKVTISCVTYYTRATQLNSVRRG